MDPSGGVALNIVVRVLYGTEDKNLTPKFADICSAWLARPDTQCERYKNMTRKTDTTSRVF